MKKIVLLAFVLVLLSMSILGTRLEITVSGSITHHVYSGESIQDAIYSGQYQNETGSDGIGETQYIIDAENQDNYPLMSQWGRVHNTNTGLHYQLIQEAINAPETLDGHTILVDAGEFIENVVVNKSVSLVGESKYNSIIDGNNTRSVIEVIASNVNITGFTIQNSGTGCPNSGIYVGEGSTSNNLSYNIITNNYVGVGLWYCSSNTLFGNNIKNNYYGIRLYESSNSNVINNNMKKNSLCIILDFSNYTHISGNNITASNYSGIHISYSSNNTISGNSIINNGYGIYIYCSSNNIFHHNNFVNNTNQVFSIGSANVWDGGYPSGGNYWSDYEDRYPDAEEIDKSGIWDAPYVIDGNNQDTYPLVPEFSAWTSTLFVLMVLTVAIAIYKQRLLKTPFAK
jgi:parallel beta-helix repeat protein